MTYTLNNMATLLGFLASALFYLLNSKIRYLKFLPLSHIQIQMGAFLTPPPLYATVLETMFLCKSACHSIRLSLSLPGRYYILYLYIGVGKAEPLPHNAQQAGEDVVDLGHTLLTLLKRLYTYIYYIFFAHFSIYVYVHKNPSIL